MAGTDIKRQNGIAIRTFRTMRGISMDDLAKILGLSYPYIANIENEHKDATAAVLERIALALDVPVKALARRPIYSDERVSA